MTTPWTPVLGDITTPDSANGLALETAARIAADAVLQAEIAAATGAVSSVYGRTGAVVKQAGDYNYSDLGNLPTTLALAGITDAYTKTASDARYAAIATTLAGYGITDAYTKTASDARYQTPQTTLSGYGITDAYTKTASDARYAAIATTLAGYGITDAYTKTAADARYAAIATTLAGYGITDAYTKTAADARYAQLATTLAGYGITDAYTKTAADARYAQLATTLAGYGITDAYTKTLSDARYTRDTPILAADTFAGTVGTALSTLSTGGQSWVMWSGAWVVNGSNFANENASVRDAAVVFDTGLTEQDMTVGFKAGTLASQTNGVIVRGVSASTYLIAQQTNGTLSIFKMVAGVKTLLTSVATTIVVSVVYRMRVTATGNVITVYIGAPQVTAGTVLSFTLTGGDITTFAGGTFVGMYCTATVGTNATIQFTAPQFRAFTNLQTTLDARYLLSDSVIGQVIGVNVPNGGPELILQIGGQSNQGYLKCWGTVLFGNNNDSLINSTSSGFMHLGTGGGVSSGVTLGDKNGTVYAKALSALFTLPTAALVQTTGGAPALATSTGVAGQFAWANGFFYVCVAANTWQRVAIATF